MWAALAVRLATTVGHHPTWAAAAAAQPTLRLLLAPPTARPSPSAAATPSDPRTLWHHALSLPTTHTPPTTTTTTATRRWLSQCSCPGLGGPPPERLFIEYDPEDVETFIAVADAVEEALPGVIVDGNVNGDGRPSSFEVTAPDGTVVFSRLQAGRLPDAEELTSFFEAPAPPQP